MQQTFILIGLFFCHWLADYTHLSMPHMLAAKRFGTPLFPILQHAAVHALIMTIFLFFIIGLPQLLVIKLTAFQLITHFLIDLWKGRMNGWFPSIQNPANKFHWYVFGFDQYLHSLVIIAMTLQAST
jgi:hypothetical protein